jgi:hypothetical protein
MLHEFLHIHFYGGDDANHRAVTNWVIWYANHFAESADQGSSFWRDSRFWKDVAGWAALWYKNNIDNTRGAWPDTCPGGRCVTPAATAAYEASVNAEPAPMEMPPMVITGGE